MLPEHKSPTTIGTWVATILQGIEQMGFSSQEVIEKAGLDNDFLANPDARIPIEDLANLWNIIVEMTGDECIGVKIGANFLPTTIHALGFAVLVSQTPMDAFKRLLKYYHLISNAVEIRAEYSGDVTSCSLITIDHMPQPADQDLDMAMALMATFYKRILGNRLNPIKLELQRKKPADTRIFDDHFQAPISYSAKHICITYKTSELEQTLPFANNEIARQNDQVIVAYLARFKNHLVSQQVHAKLIEILPMGEPSIEALARSMGLSTSSLQKRLKSEEVSYRKILNDVRMELAEDLLRQPTLSIIEVAFQLGYSDSSNFSRAFKRWHGVSPKAYRQNLNMNN